MNDTAPVRDAGPAAAARGRGVGLTSAGRVLCLAYIGLLPANIPLAGPLFMHDLLAVPLALLVVVGERRDRRGWLHFPDVLLPVFLGLAAFSTAAHLRGPIDAYEWAIFGYMAVLFAAFRRFRPSIRSVAAVGLATLGALWLFAVAEFVSGSRATYDVYTGSTLGFIAKRYFATFPHPNLAGSFYVLPVVCVLLPCLDSPPPWSARQWVLATGVAAVLLVPLGLTVSKHMLLTLAVLAGYAVVVLRANRWCPRVPWTRLALGGVAAVFLFFLLTVLFPFFPLQSSFPFFNCSTRGMYSVHQAIYARLIVRDAGVFLVGVGRSGVMALYPTLADWDATYAILDQYGQAFLTETFTRYMDAHNEYLNLGTAFGVPSVLAVMAFWGAHVPRLRRGSGTNTVLGFFALAVLLVAFWDDILSKRWIWVTLGLLTAGHPAEATTCPNRTEEPDR